MALNHEIPFLDWMGVTLAEWSSEHALLTLAITPQHLNRSGVVHGGIYAILADAAGGLAGCYSHPPAAHRKSYTLSLTTSFLGAAAQGRLNARGSLRRRGRRVYFATVEITSDAGELLALAEGSFLYRTPGSTAHADALPGEP